MLLASLSKKFGVDLNLINPKKQLQAVMAWYPNKRFYERSSSKSGKKIISVYSPDCPSPVYSHEEWYADDWSPPFLEVDFEASFFDQFRNLQKIAPVVALLSNLQENAQYCQDSEGLKDCYVVFDALNCRDVYYSTRIYDSKNCVDGYWVMNSELLYDCVYMFECYNTRYSFNCHQVSDSAFLFNCRNVQHSFMCSNLRNKEYYVYNQQCTREQYEEFIKKIPWSDYRKMLEFKRHFKNEIVAKAPIPPAFLENCEEAAGNYLKRAAHVERVFESFDIKDAYNSFQCAKGRDIVGSFMCNDRVERCFQCVATGIESYDVRNCAFTWHSSFMEYCYLCLNCQNCFGCIGLRNKKYHIFNKPYSKEEYEKTVARLIQTMKAKGEYGRFFPQELSPFPYENTIAYDLFEPHDTSLFDLEYEKGIISSSATNDNEVRICLLSGKPFKIIPQELQFYQKHSIPLPRVLPALRYKARMEMMDTGFENKMIPKNSENLTAFFAHPQNKNIVGYKEYENSIV